MDAELDICLDEGLQPCQISALINVREAARDQHSAALPRLRERLERLGFCAEDLEITLQWIQMQAPIVVPVDLEKIAGALLADTHLRNQFETESRSPLQDVCYAEWEESLFAGSYTDAPSALRCKYGFLNVTNDASGVLKESGTIPWSYLVLRNVRHRTTFISYDSTSPYAEGAAMSIQRVASIDYFAHVLHEHTDAELRSVLNVGTQRLPGCDAGVLESCKEAQIHGDVRLSDNVEAVMANPKLRTGAVAPLLEKLAEHCKASLVWMGDGSVGYLTATPCAGPSAPPIDEDAALEAALKASLEESEKEKLLRAKETDDLEHAMSLSAQSSSQDEELARTILASMRATSHAVVSVSGPSAADLPVDTTPAVDAPTPSAISTAVTENEGSNKEEEYVLKVNFSGDLRRFRISWSLEASVEEISTAIYGLVHKSFELAAGEHSLKYEDEDGDLCTLVPASVADYLRLCKGSTLQKLCVCTCSTPKSQVIPEALQVAAETKELSVEEASPELTPISEAPAPAAEAAGGTTLDDKYESPRPQLLEEPSMAPETVSEEVLPEPTPVVPLVPEVPPVPPLPPLPQVPPVPAVPPVPPVPPVSPLRTMEAMNAGNAGRSPDLDEVSESVPTQLEEAMEIVETERADEVSKTESDEFVHVIEPAVPASEGDATSTPQEVQEFSMETPPASPRSSPLAEPGSASRRTSSIEDEYKDEYIAWTFVAEPSQ